MGPLGMSAKQHREYLKLQSQEQREAAKMERDESRKNQLHEIKLQEAAVKANQGIGHKEDLHAVKLQELGSPLGKPPKMNREKMGLPSINPMAGTGMFKQGQHKMYAQGTDTVPAMLTPGEAVIPAPAAQNPKNKKAIQRMVQEGRQKNKLRDGAVDVRYSDAPGQAKYHADGTVGIPSLAYEHPDVPGSSFENGTERVYDRGSSAQANYADGSYGVVPQQVQQAAGYFNGTDGVPEWDPNYTMNVQLPQAGEGVQVAANNNDPFVEELIRKRKEREAELASQTSSDQNTRADIYSVAKDRVPTATAVPGFNRMGNVAPVVPPEEYIKRTVPSLDASNKPAVPVAKTTIPFSNPNANQTEFYKPANDIDKMDPYTLFKGAESSGVNTAKNPLSSAAGPVQFTKGTWDSIRKQVPELAGVEYGSKAFYSDEAQKLAFNHTNAQNESILNKSRIPVDNVSRYVMHGLGASDGKAILANPTGNFRDSLNNPDLVIAQNPVYANFKTNQDYIDWAKNHLNKSAGIGRDSNVAIPVPRNVDSTQLEQTNVGKPFEYTVPPNDKIPAEERERTVALFAKDADAQLAKLQAQAEDIKDPKEKQSFLEKAVGSIFGESGLFNNQELIRFAITAAGGMMTGARSGRAIQFAARDVLKASDTRHQQQAVLASEERKYNRTRTDLLNDKREAAVNEANKNTRERNEALTTNITTSFSNTSIPEEARQKARAHLSDIKSGDYTPSQKTSMYEQLHAWVNSQAIKDQPDKYSGIKPGYIGNTPVEYEDVKTKSGATVRHQRVTNPDGTIVLKPNSEIVDDSTWKSRTSDLDKSIEDVVGASVANSMLKANSKTSSAAIAANTREIVQHYKELRNQINPSITNESFTRMVRNTEELIKQSPDVYFNTEARQKAFYGGAILQLRETDKDKFYNASDKKNSYVAPTAMGNSKFGGALMNIVNEQANDPQYKNVSKDKILDKVMTVLETKWDALNDKQKESYRLRVPKDPNGKFETSPMMQWVIMGGYNSK